MFKHLGYALCVLSVWRKSSSFARKRSQLRTQIVHWRICILKLDISYRRGAAALWRWSGNGSGWPWQWSLQAWLDRKGGGARRLENPQLPLFSVLVWFDSRRHSIPTQIARSCRVSTKPCGEHRIPRWGHVLYLMTWKKEGKNLSLLPSTVLKFII